MNHYSVTEVNIHKTLQWGGEDWWAQVHVYRHSPLHSHRQLSFYQLADRWQVRSKPEWLVASLLWRQTDGTPLIKQKPLWAHMRLTASLLSLSKDFCEETLTLSPALTKNCHVYIPSQDITLTSNHFLSTMFKTTACLNMTLLWFRSKTSSLFFIMETVGSCSTSV